MKINVLTDLHLEFGQCTLPGGEILLLCGDIVVADLMRPNRTDQEARKFANRWKQFFRVECAKYDQVFYIMGNHEHYHGMFDNTADILRDALVDTNVKLLEKDFVDLGEWRLFGATLWTNFNNRDWFAVDAAKRGMNDFYCVKKLKQGDEPVIGEKVPYVGIFHPTEAADEHDATLQALSDGCYDWEHIDRPTIVMTHHTPSFHSVNLKHRHDMLTHAYTTNLEDFIMDHPNIKYWFHGHTHYTFDYMIGDCRVVCNPRGYHGHKLNPDFNINLEIEI